MSVKNNRKNTLIFISEVAQRTGISEQLLRAYCRAGAFETADKVRGTRWVICEKEVRQIENDEINFSGIFAND